MWADHPLFSWKRTACVVCQLDVKMVSALFKAKLMVSFECYISHHFICGIISRYGAKHLRRFLYFFTAPGLLEPYLLQLHLSQNHWICGKHQLGEWDEFAIHNTSWLHETITGDNVDSTGDSTTWQNLALLAAFFQGRARWNGLRFRLTWRLLQLGEGNTSGARTIRTFGFQVILSSRSRTPRNPSENRIKTPHAPHAPHVASTRWLLRVLLAVA